MGQTPEELRAGITGTRADMTATLDAITDRASPRQAARRKAGQLSQRVSGVRNAVMGQVDDVTRRGSDAGAGGSNNTQNKELINEPPLPLPAAYAGQALQKEGSATARQQNQLANLRSKQKKNAKSIFLSATPAAYEIELAEEVVEQIIRPTGLLDPITYVYPKS